MKVLMTLVLVLLLGGCAAGQRSAGPTSTEVETTARHAEEETTVLQGGGDLRRPPDSTLSYGGREVKGQLGSYCWSYGNSGVCADAVPITPPREQTLTIPSGSEMVFHYGGHRLPKTVEIYVRPLGKKGGLHPSLEAHGSGVERTIPAELPPGEYVLEVFVKELQGDASYYFRVMVK